MSLYFAITGALMFFSLVSVVKVGYQKRNHDNNILYAYIALLLISMFWMLTAFRDQSIGTDTRTYIRGFKDIVWNGLNVDAVFERGYIFFSYLVSKITSSPHIYLVIHATICYLAFTIYIFKYSNNILVSTTLLFCFAFSAYTNIMRQALAMVVCLRAYVLLKQGKKREFSILVLIASTIHTSALVFFTLLFERFIPQKRKTIIISSVVAFALSISGKVVLMMLNSSIFYARYASSKYAGTGYLAVSFHVTRTLLFMALYYYAYPEKKSIEKADLFMLLVLNVMGFSINIFTRMSEYFLLPLMVEIPNCFYTERLSKKKWILCCCCIFSLLYFLVACIYRPEWNTLYPYKFWK